MSRISRPWMVICALLFIVVVVTIAVARKDDARTGEGIVPLADSRHVENVTCEGKCDGILLVSDQQPDVRYFGDENIQACTEVNVWANATSREGQITIGGYGFYNGFQKNLRTRTVEPEAIDGREVVFNIPKTGTSEENWQLTATLRDQQEWNVLDTLRYSSNEEAPNGFLITTERDSGLTTLLDTCTAEQKAVTMYALYQAPVLFATADVYEVTIRYPDVPSAPEDVGNKTLYTTTYTLNDLMNDFVHVVAPVGDATFSFDLVKD